jgi:hypothetical protein
VAEVDLERLETLHYEAMDYDQVQELEELQANAAKRVEAAQAKLQPRSEFDRMLEEAAERGKYRTQDKDKVMER